MGYQYCPGHLSPHRILGERGSSLDHPCQVDRILVHVDVPGRDTSPRSASICRSRSWFAVEMRAYPISIGPLYRKLFCTFLVARRREDSYGTNAGGVSQFSKNYSWAFHFLGSETPIVRDSTRVTHYPGGLLVGAESTRRSCRAPKPRRGVVYDLGHERLRILWWPSTDSRARMASMAAEVFRTAIFHQTRRIFPAFVSANSRKTGCPRKVRRSRRIQGN